MPDVKIKITGLDDIIKRYPQAPARIEQGIKRAFLKSLFSAIQQVRTRTPVKTGHLKRSIGNPAFGGWKWIKGKIASMGTNINYAIWVEVRRARHPVGDWKYMERGIQASLKNIKGFFEREIADAIRKLTMK